jgi:AcrR family transcriptional regulator
MTARRRRGEALEESLLQAAWDELAAVGYPKLTMEGVAARAKTSRAVLYRRWPNRVELVLAAMRRHAPMLSGEVPDTGDLRGDLLALLRRVTSGLEAIGSETIHGMLSEYIRDLDATVYPHGRRVGAQVMSVILERAAERGEIDRAKITPRIAGLPTDLVRHEVLITQRPLPDGVLVEIVDDIFLPLVRA